MPSRLPERLPDHNERQQPELNQQIAGDHGNSRAERPHLRRQHDRQYQENGELQPLRPHQKVSAIAVIGVAQRQDRRRNDAGADQQRHCEKRIVGDSAVGPECEEIRPKRQEHGDHKARQQCHEYRSMGIKASQALLCANGVIVAKLGRQRKRRLRAQAAQKARHDAG